MFRIRHKNNALFSFGTEGWNPCEGMFKSVSAYGSYGLVHEGVQATINGYAAFCLEQKFFHLFKAFVRLEKGNTHGFLQATVNGELK